MAALVRITRVLPALRPFSNVTRKLSHLSLVRYQTGINCRKTPSITGICRNLIRNASAAVQQDTLPYKENKLESISSNIEACLLRFNRVNKIDFDAFLSIATQIEYKLPRDKCRLLLLCTGNRQIELSISKRAELTDFVWSKLKEYGAPIDHTIYNTLLSVYIQNERTFSPTEILAEMQEIGITPNRVTYVRFIAAYCQEGDIPAATQILEYMKSQDFSVSSDVFHSFITGHTRANDAESAKNVLKIMREVGLGVTSETYGTLMCGLAELKDYKAVEEMLRECESEGVLLQSNHIIDLILSLVQTGHYDLNQELYTMLGKLSRYNNIAINKINTLLALGFDDVAYELYCNMPKPSSSLQNTDSSRYFLRFLARNCTPTDKVYEMLNDMRDRAFTNVNILEVAHIAYLENNADYALKLLEKASREGLPFPSHCYLPALCQYGDVRDKEKMLGVMKMIVNIDENQPVTEVMLDYFLPLMLKVGESIDSVVDMCKDIGISDGIVNFVYCMYQVHSGNWEAAVNFGTENKMLVKPGNLRHYFGLGLKVDHDWTNALKIVDICQKELSRDIIGCRRILILDMLHHSNQTKDWTKAEQFLDNNNVELFKEDKLIIESTDVYHNAPDSIKSKLGSLIFKDYQWERLRVDSNIYPTPFHLRKLVNFHTSENKDLDKATKYYEMLDSQYPEYAEYERAMLNLVLLNIEHGHSQVAIDLMSKYASKHSDYMKQRNFSENYILGLPCRNIMDMTNLKCPDATSDVADAIRSCGYVNLASYSLLSTYAQGVLSRDDDDEVIKGFQDMIKQYQTVCLLSEFMERFIKKEDPEKLQKVMDLAIPILGEDDVLNYLVVTFMNCGHPKKAMKVFETQGVGKRVCELFVKIGQISALEEFVNQTKSANLGFREEILFTLIRGYAKFNNAEKALDVLVQFEEENIEPKPRTLRYLAKILSANGIEIPFEIPKIEENNVFGLAKPRKEKLRTTYTVNEKKENMEDYSIEKLLRTKQQLTEDGHPEKFLPLLKRVIKDKNNDDVHILLEQLSSNGNIDDLQSIVDSQDLRAFIVRNAKKKLFLACIKKGEVDQLLNKLENINDDIDFYLVQLSLKTLYDDYPEQFKRAEELAKAQHTSKNSCALGKFIMLHIQNNNTSHLNQLLQMYPNIIEFQSAINYCSWAKATKDVEAISRFTDAMRGYNHKHLTLGYSFQIEVNVINGDIDKALEVVEKLQSDNLSIKNIHSQVVKLLERALVEKNKPIPWSSAEDTSSSDSSDDEKRK